jgi:hypothetical protein
MRCVRRGKGGSTERRSTDGWVKRKREMIEVLRKFKE